MKTLIGLILGAGAGVGLSMLLRPKPTKRVVVYNKEASNSIVQDELEKAGIKAEKITLKNPTGWAVTVDEKDAERAIALIADLEKTGKLRKMEMGRINIVAPGNRVGFSDKFVDDLHYS